jgi:hypothetical protein
MDEEFIPGDPLLLVSIREAIKTLPVFDATRYAWPVNPERAKNRIVLGCNKGVVEGVFMPSEWLDASPGQASERNFPGFKWTHKDQRWGFNDGEDVPEWIRKRYFGKRVPSTLRIGQKGFRYFDPV